MFMGANYSTGAVFHATPALFSALPIHRSRWRFRVNIPCSKSEARVFSNTFDGDYNSSPSDN